MTATLQADAPADIRKRFPVSRKPLFMAVAAIIVAALGIAWILSPPSRESTDNAYLKADSTIVAPRISGQVVAVLVQDNQPVKAGDPLVRIDSEEFEAKLLAARASVADADAGVAAARAAIVSLGAENRLAASDVAVAQTAISAAQAELVRADADGRRYEALAGEGFATRRDLERVRTTAAQALALEQRSHATLAAARDKAGVTATKRASLDADLARAIAVAARARATLRLAEQDEGYTLIRAPVSGIVGNRQVQTGDMVQPGTRLLTIVPDQGLYVVANFKETQTARMIVGQKAKIAVDALGGDALTGRVQSFAPGSGSEFALLPFEPGSGNFTKIVQRVPVRIALDPGQTVVKRLRPGLSVTATVRLRD